MKFSEKKERLEAIYESYGQLNKLKKIYISNAELDDYSPIILKSFLITESLLIEILIDNRIEINHGVVIPDNITVINYVCRENMFPIECSKIINEMKKTRNSTVHGSAVSYEDMYSFCNSFEYFIYWLLDNYHVHFIVKDNNYDLRNEIFHLFNKRNQKEIIDMGKMTNVGIATIGGVATGMAVAAAPVAVPVVGPVIGILGIATLAGKKLFSKGSIVSDLNEKEFRQLILERIDVVSDKVDRNLICISDKIDNLSSKIENYQSLIQKQLLLIDDENEREKLLSAFVDECAEKIIVEFRTKESQNEREKEEKKLILSLGKSVWDKLDPHSKTFLVSAKIIFNNLILQNDIDYSSVCLLVTKALELELSKRFCDDFINYIKRSYPHKDNSKIYPTILLDKYGKPIKSKHFTLGSFAYLVGFNDDTALTKRQKKNNKQILLEYSKNSLFENKSDKEIINLLFHFAQEIEIVKTKYRNPAAHIKELTQIDAEQCFALVIDVEKLLKQMLESFTK